MARAGSSSKFVPVNLNNSYGQPLSISNGGSSAGLGRSRSFGSSYGGMVSLSRSSRVSSSSSSSTVSASSRASKLTVPRPVNLPSLRREHSGNDPTIALVGSSGSSGWTKQTGDESLDTAAPRSDGVKSDSSWGNQPALHGRSVPASDSSNQIAVRRQSAYSPPKHGIPVPSPVERAVVFRGEDFPTLQAAAVPSSPSIPPQPRPRSSQHKRSEEQKSPSQQQSAGFDVLQSKSPFEPHFQPAQPMQLQARPDQAGSSSTERTGAHLRGPSPLIHLTHTSNWADDERETLSSLQTHDRVHSDWTESNNGFRSASTWVDHNSDIDVRRPTSRNGYPGRNNVDFLMQTGSGYTKEGDFKRGFTGGRFELEHRSDFDRLGSNPGRNEFLKRGWSFSAAESNLKRDIKFGNVSIGNEHETGRTFYRDGNNFSPGRELYVQPGLQAQDAGQGRDSKFGKDVLLGKQGFPGGLVSPGLRTGRGLVFSHSGSDAAMLSKSQPFRKDAIEMDYKREKRATGYYSQVHDDDPFLGDGIGSRVTSLYGNFALDSKGIRMKKENLKGDDLRDPARESFEAELERVEKMLEQERQKAAEERERAIELVKKEQEEQDRLAREEEELRLKLEEEAAEAAYRAQRESEDAARKVEETRKAREDEKRIAALEEERRKEAARRKLLELEERIAKRESERRREESPQERGSTMRTVGEDFSIQPQDGGRRSGEMNREQHWKLPFSSTKVEQAEDESGSSMVRPAFPSNLKSPRLSTHAKDENGLPSGVRPSQMWKREAPDSGIEHRVTHKGPMKISHVQDDSSQQEHEQQHRRPSFRVRSRKDPVLTDIQERASFDNPDDIEERNWWGRDGPSRSQYPVPIYSHSTDASEYSADAGEYPSFGRLRQSLPKQPRVLPPPPPVHAVSRKPAFQPDDRNFGNDRPDMASMEEFTLTTDDEVIVGHEGTALTDVQVSKRFDSAPSEEVVLSDAGSQFSDDTVEDTATPTIQAYQEQELHSDMVSETETEEEVGEISDLTEAQESSEDLDSQKPIDWQVSKEQEITYDNMDGIEQVSKSAIDCFQGQDEGGKDEPKIGNQEEERQGKVLEKCEDDGKESTSRCLVEDVANVNAGSQTCLDEDYECSEEETERPLQAEVTKDGQFQTGNTVDLPTEKIVCDQEMHPFHFQASFLPVNAENAAHVRHLEGVSSRQSIVQQFQQPFSFMAVPLPQSNTLNHVGVSPPILSSMHGLPNQQELPFHLQLGLLPSLPLVPNSIQIGSIQMPLHIHPQISQLAHPYGQQAPVFQFGQIGHSMPVSQPGPMTQLPVQVHHAIGQGTLSEHHQLQAHVKPVNVIDSANFPADSNIHKEGAAVQDAAAPTIGHNFSGDLSVGINQLASGSSRGLVCNSEEHAFVERDTQTIASTTSKCAVSGDQSGQKQSSEDKFESTTVGDSSLANHGARPGIRSSRGLRRSHVPRYQGILGRGRGRFHAGQNYSYQVSNLMAEGWVESGNKGLSRGRMFRRNYRRTEYRVREPLPLLDEEYTVGEMPPAPTSNVEDSKEGKGYRYVKKGVVNHSRSAGEPVASASSSVLQAVTKGDKVGSQNVMPISSKTKGLQRKYETNDVEDSSFRTGVVRVFEQPGIETPNDKDDFIRVRSKRQLLRELREQREKAREQVVKKQQRSSPKAGSNSGLVPASSNKSSARRRSTRGSEAAAMGGRYNTPSAPRGGTGISAEAFIKRTLTLPKGIMDSENCTHDNHIGEQSTTTAWGGHRSNQEVVSLTQIQLEEAMKPFRVDVPFQESVRLPEKAIVTLEPGLLCNSAVSVEKIAAPVKASGPISSLLAGEKIQFGAVTSPTLLPSSNQPPSPLPVGRTGSPLGFRPESSHSSSQSNSFVANFLESHIDTNFTSKVNTEDGFNGKVVDLEAEAEAAASAVAAAAISSEDLIDSLSNTRVDPITKSSGLCVTNPLSVQSQSSSSLDNPSAVALPADLSVETLTSFFQGPSMTLPNSSGVVLQSLPGGAPTYPCVEMGSLLGGPVFSYGPREEASMEPGLSGWQQRHIGTPDSFYGPPPYMSPAGLSSIQGHPHMLVYANPFPPVGQFGQLGVSFMGAAYHPSGKQPDWTHIPLPSSSGGLALNDGDLSAGSNGMMTSQHLAGASSVSTLRTQVAGSSVMPMAAPSNPFNAGFAASFQIAQMDGLVQSHWSKAPAPPVHTVPIQNAPPSRPAVEFNMQVQSSRVLSNQLGHLPHLMDVSSGFHHVPDLKPLASSSFSSADAAAQFPDELGLGDCTPTVNTVLGDANGPDSGGHMNSLASGGTSVTKLQRGRRPYRSSQAHGSSSSHNVELISGANTQDQSKSGDGDLESRTKNLRQGGSSSFLINSVPFVEQRASKQASATGAEWSRSSQRKGASGRISTSDKGGSVLPSKIKQIYVAKPAVDSRKLSAGCS